MVPKIPQSPSPIRAPHIGNASNDQVLIDVSQKRQILPLDLDRGGERSLGHRAVNAL